MFNPFRRKKIAKDMKIKDVKQISEIEEQKELDRLKIKFENFNIYKCELCKDKTIRSKIKKNKENKNLYQFVKCRNPECPFHKKIEFKI